MRSLTIITSQADLRNLELAEVDLVVAIDLRRPDGHRVVAEGFAHTEPMPAEINFATRIHFTHPIAGFVQDGRQDFWKRTRAGLIPAGRWLHTKASWGRSKRGSLGQARNPTRKREWSSKTLKGWQ